MTKIEITRDYKVINLNGNVPFMIKPGMAIFTSKRRRYIVTISNDHFIRVYRGSKEGLIRETFYENNPFNLNADDHLQMNILQSGWNGYINPNVDVNDPFPVVSGPVMEIFHYNDGSIMTIDHRKEYRHKDHKDRYEGKNDLDWDEADLDWDEADLDWDEADLDWDEADVYEENEYEKKSCDRNSICCPFRTYCDSVFFETYGKLPCTIAGYDPVTECETEEMMEKFIEYISDEGNVICEE